MELINSDIWFDSKSSFLSNFQISSNITSTKEGGVTHIAILDLDLEGLGNPCLFSDLWTLPGLAGTHMTQNPTSCFLTGAKHLLRACPSKISTHSASEQ